MAPVPPSTCGVGLCCGDATQKGLTLKCNIAQHHKGFLVKDTSGHVSWAWATRGPSQLTKAGLTVLTKDPDEGGPEVAAPIHDAPVEVEDLVPRTPEKSSCGKDVLGFSDVKVHGRLNFGGRPKRMEHCVVCEVERTRDFRGKLGMTK